jgi:hypothetical protein
MESQIKALGQFLLEDAVFGDREYHDRWIFEKPEKTPGLYLPHNLFKELSKSVLS